MWSLLADRIEAAGFTIWVVIAFGVCAVGCALLRLPKEPKVTERMVVVFGCCTLIAGMLGTFIGASSNATDIFGDMPAEEMIRGGLHGALNNMWAAIFFTLLTTVILYLDRKRLPPE